MIRTSDGTINKYVKIFSPLRPQAHLKTYLKVQFLHPRKHKGPNSVYSENHTKTINILRELNEELLNIKAGGAYTSSYH
jgi:hypothetical protein